MLPTEDLFVHVYVLVDDAIAAGEVTIPARPGPTPACSDAELLTIALVRHLLGRRSDAGFVAEMARDWAQLFPGLPHQSEANRRIRWLWAAFEQLRAALAAGCPVDDCAQVDTTALPVKHPSRVRGPTAGSARTSWSPASAATVRTASGSTASGWRFGPPWGPGWCAPGASCPPRSTSVTSLPLCSRPGHHRATSSLTRASPGGPSPPATSPCSPRPSRPRAPACPASCAQ